MEDPKLAKTALIVLGMHRSGTSALAGVVGHLGAALPQDLMAGTEMNAKGFFESNRIMKLNDSLLDAAGTTWWDPRRFPDDWLDSDAAEPFLAEAVDTLALDYGEAPVFVMKDPRVCRLMPFWRKALTRFGARPLVIHTHRPPLDVAPSLTRWTGYDAEYGLLLWERHILDAEAESRDLPRAFTCYDSLLTDWRSEMVRIAQVLDFAWPCPPETVQSVVDDFLSRDLQHFHDRDHNRSADDLPPLLTQTLDIMDRWARDGEAREDHATLDEMRAAMDQVGPLYDALARKSVLRAKEVTSLQGKLDDLGGQMDRRSAEFDELNARHGTLMECHETAERQLKTFADQQEQEQAERQELSIALNDPTVASLRMVDMIGRVQEASALSQEEKARADRLSAELAKAVEARDSLKAQSDGLSAELARAVETRDSLEAQSSRLSAERARLAADVKAAQQTEQKLSAERDSLAAVCQRLTAERDQARAETSQCEAAFLASTSWRVTAPLRFVSRLVRRGRQAS